MARIVNYSVECPTCKCQGVSRTLGFDPEVGGICCEAEKPHIFDSLPGEPSEVKRPELETETQQTAVQDLDTQGSGESEPNRLSEIMRERAQGLQGEDSPRQDIPESAKGFAPLVKPRDFGGQLTDVEPGTGYVGEGETRELVGGDVLVGVRILEQWRQAVSAEAELRGQTFGEYLQDFLNNVALFNEWSSPVDAT